MNKKILIVCALSQELKTVRNEIKKLKIANLDIKFFACWVWNYNAIYNIKDYLEKNSKPDFIINIWVCWKKEDKTPDNIFSVYRVFNKDSKKESLCPIYIDYLELKSILSSEKVIINSKDMIWENYVDMESFGIDYVCTKESIAYIMIKIPFDIVWKKSNSVDIDKLKKKISDSDYKPLLKKVSNYIEENKKEEIDLSNYKDHFSFSFSEFEQFKKLYNKYIALKKWDFEVFFIKHKSLDKKSFLKKLV